MRTSVISDNIEQESKDSQEEILLKQNKRRKHSQTNGSGKVLGLHIKEVAIQTDIAYNDKRFVSIWKHKHLYEDD